MPFEINPEISKASTLPKEFYLDNQYFSFCRDKIFPNSWQPITTLENLQTKNIFPFTFLSNFIDEPLVIINEDDKIKCFSNVCTHRAHIIAENECHRTKLRCRYHGRTYNLNGSFKSMPGFEEAQNFPTEKDNLQSIPIKSWKNFIFVSLTGNIDITHVLNDVEKRLPSYPFEDLIHDKNNSECWELDAHWALYCENYLEGFHVPYVHKGLSQEIDVSTYDTLLLENAVLQIATGETDDDVLQNPNSKDNDIYGLYYWIFPNLMLNFYSWGLSINIIEPITKNKTRIRFLSYPIKDKIQPKNGNASLDQIEKEDQSVVLNVQKGIKSRFYNSGRYSPQHEKGVHHFHLLLSKYLA